jgi:AraC-like DNA-binding protein
MSAYQFDRRVRRLFRLTTGQLLLKLRIHAAAERLRDADRAVAQVASACGDSDQGAFTRQFRKTISLTPVEYRSAYRQEAGPRSRWRRAPLPVLDRSPGGVSVPLTRGGRSSGDSGG